MPFAVVECAHRQPKEAQDISAGKPQPAAIVTLEFDLPVFDHDECIPPLVPAIGASASGRDRHHAQLKGRRQLPVKERDSFAFGTHSR